VKTAWLAGAALSVFVAGAASAQDRVPQPTAPAAAAEVYDPWEPFNRRMFSVHKGLDRAVVGPVARGYRAVTPTPVRRGVSNAVANLGEPVTFVNDVLQVQPTRAAKTATRFVVNTTAGVLGVFDVAGKAGLPRHYEDFGQTLGRYGAGPGPYLFIPVLGPSTVRDAGGRVVDGFVNPINQADFQNATEVRTGVYVVTAVSARADLEPELRRMEQTATDEYATYRSLYLQNRRAEIANGSPTSVEDLPDFGEPAPEPRPTPPRRRR
jgi:phospholipid-binding lipoprotein MlaA